MSEHDEPQTEQTVVATITPIQALQQMLEKRADAFAAVLPSNTTPEKFTRIVMMAVTKNNDLLLADRASLYNAALDCARDGLLPDGREAALATFNTKIKLPNGGEEWRKIVQYMPMYAGILKKVRNSGELTSITAHVVYENDEFDHWSDDDGDHVMYRAVRLGKPKGEKIGVYAHAKMKDGGVYVEVLDCEAIAKVRAVSRSGNVWNNWTEEMEKKTAIRRMSKRLPVSSDLAEFFRRDDALTDLAADAEPTADAPPQIERQRPPAGSSSVAERIKAQAAAQPPIEREIQRRTFVGGDEEIPANATLDPQYDPDTF